MEPNSAPAASPAPDPSAASTEVTAPAVDDYGFPTADALDTSDMSDEALEAFVDQTLGVKHAAPVQSPQPAEKPSTAPVGAGSPTSTGEPATNPESEAPPTPVAPVEAEPAPQLADIPDLDTSDLWIEVTNTDGEKVRLTLDDGVPDDFMFANDKQLYEVLDSFNEMKQLRADRQTMINEATTKAEAAQADTQTQQQTMTGWANEIQDLVDVGLIPNAEKQPADGKVYTPAEIAADPGLKLTSEVFEFMKTENAKRANTGKSAITSFASAFTLYQNDTTRAAVAEKAKADAARTKARGAIVGGSSAPTASDKGYVYKRGSARNIWQVPTDDI